MNVEEYIRLTQLVLDDTTLPEAHKDKKIVQIADLARFVNAYNSLPDIASHLIIVDIPFHSKLNLVAEGGMVNGLIFFEMGELRSSEPDQDMVLAPPINELWVVFVNERNSIDSNLVNEFLEKSNSNSIWNKVFIMDFANSTIKRIEQKKENE